jgi:phage shock protein PspC (stress-responsive transcriptional regulator)
MKFLHKGPISGTSKIGVVGIGLGLVMAAVGCSVNFTEDLTYIELIKEILPIIGLVVTSALGIGFAGAVGRELHPRVTGAKVHSGIGAAGFIGVGAILLWVSQLSSLPHMIGGIVAIGLGLLLARYARATAAPPTWLRYFMILAAFVAGALPGVVLYFILSFVVSDRYCQLTSSKCL